MSNPYEPKPSEQFKPREDPEKYSHGNYLGYAVEFIDRSSLLIETLEEYATPTRRSYELEFTSQESGESAYPEALKDRLLTRYLKSILVTITQEDDEPSTTTIEFHDEDGTIHVSRDSLQSVLPEDPEYFFDVVIDNQGKPKTIPKIPNYEINALLFSLAGNYREAEHRALLQNKDDRVVGEDVFAALCSNAVRTTSDLEYKLDDDRTVYFTKVSNAGRDKLVSFRIKYKDNNRDKRSAEVSLEKGLAIVFKSYEGITPGDIYPDEDDYDELIRLLVEETDSILSDKGRPDEPIGIITDEVSAELSDNLADPNPSNT